MRAVPGWRAGAAIASDVEVVPAFGSRPQASQWVNVPPGASGSSTNRRTVAELPRDAKFLVGLVVGFTIAPVLAILIMAGLGIS
jgi:hypothetical protein